MSGIEDIWNARMEEEKQAKMQAEEVIQEWQAAEYSRWERWAALLPPKVVEAGYKLGYELDKFKVFEVLEVGSLKQVSEDDGRVHTARMCLGSGRI
jgi:hypothetical protein